MSEYDTSSEIFSEEALRVQFEEFLLKHTELTEKVDLVRRASDLEISIGNWAYLPKSSDFFIHILHACELLRRHNLNLKDKRMLDLGCGSGRVINFLSWLYGLEGLGIEIYPVIAQEANQVGQEFRTQPGFESVNTRVVSGNFFPADFDVPDKIKWWELTKRRRKQLDVDPYKALGVSLEEIDIFYFYQFSNNTPWVLKLIAQRAKRGAQILFPDFHHYSDKIELPEGVEVIEAKGRVGLLQVRK